MYKDVLHELSGYGVIHAHLGKLQEVLLQMSQVLLLDYSWWYTCISLEYSAVDGEGIFILEL